MTATHITGIQDRRHSGRQTRTQRGLRLRRHPWLPQAPLTNPTPSGGRWIELAPGTDTTIVTLEPAAPDQTRGAIGTHPLLTD